MSEKVIRPRKRLMLRKIKSQYMIVDACAENMNISNVYSLNECAAEMWQQICSRDYTAEELAQWLCSHYDVDYDIALQDVEQQISEWEGFGMLDV